MKKKKGFWALNIGLLYILPWLVGFLLFKVYPFASSLYYSFTNYDSVSYTHLDVYKRQAKERGYIGCACPCS